MTKWWVWQRPNNRRLFIVVLAVLLLAGLMLYKLGSLVGGVAASEARLVVMPVGWHGIYQQPLYLPLKLWQSVIFFLAPGHGQTLSRLPNAFFGVATIVSFVILVRLWHSWRTAVLAGLLFATAAWTLHVSRIASYDVLYLWALPTILLSNVLLQRYPKHYWAWFYLVVSTGLLLYVPGIIWLIIINLFFLRKQIFEVSKYLKKAPSAGLILLALLFLPLLIRSLVHPAQLRLWLGLPANLPGALTVLHRMAAVPFHLFVRGPLYTELWLGRSPILDVFTLLACIIGIYFYVTHLRAARTQLIIALGVASWFLVGLAGAVSFSLLVPLLYIIAATGIAYLIHEWLAVFPLNPLARSLGLVLISVVVVFGCIYNLRAYFVAWPNNPTTRSVFRYHL